MPRDHLQAEIERLRARIARDTLDLVRLEQMQADRLRIRGQGGNTEKMVAAERVRVSQGKRDGSPLRDACNASNLTIRHLAQKLKAEGFEATHSLLSQAHVGKRSISERLARRVEALTGLPATTKSWPRLRTGE